MTSPASQPVAAFDVVLSGYDRHGDAGVPSGPVERLAQATSRTVRG